MEPDTNGRLRAYGLADPAFFPSIRLHTFYFLGKLLDNSAFTRAT